MSSTFRDLLQDFPALPSLQCVVSAVSLSSTPHSDDLLSQAPSQESSGEGTSTSTQPEVWSTEESSSKGFSSKILSAEEFSSEGASSSTLPKIRSIITPPENITWTSAQLAPFVQRLAPGQPIEGTLVSPLFPLPLNKNVDVDDTIVVVASLANNHYRFSRSDL